MAGAGGSAGVEVGRISIRVVPDLDGFYRTLKSKLEEIERTVRGKVPVEIEIDENGARQKMAALRKSLGGTVKLDVDVDTNPVRRAMSRIFGGGGGGGGPGGMGGRAGAMSMLLNGNLYVAAAALSLLAPGLALVSGLLTTLPGVLAGVLVPIGALALGMDGLKNAASVLAPDLERLKGVMNTAFEDRFTPIFENLRSVFPVLERAMPAVARGLGDMADAFVNTLTSEEGLGRIDSIVGSISKSLSAAAPGVGSFTDGLLTLADKVAAKFPKLSEWFNKVGDSFDKWVTKITTAGPDGKSPLDQALSTLKDVTKTLGETGVDALKKGFEWLSDPEFGEKIKQFAENLKSITNNVLPELKNIFGIISDLSALIDKITAWKPPEWMTKETPKEDIVPGSDKGPFSKGIVKDSPLHKLQQWWDDPDRKFLKDGPDFSGWWDGMKAPFETAGNWISTTIQGWKTQLSEAWWGFGNSAHNAINGVKNWFAQLPAQITAQVMMIGAQIGMVFSQIPARLQGIWAGVQAAAAGAWNGIVSIVANVIGQIIAVAASVPGRVAGVWQGIVAMAQGVWNQVVSTAASVLAGVVSTFVSIGGQVMAEVGSWPGKIIGLLGNLAGQLAEAGRSAGAALVNGLAGAIAGGVGAVAGAVGKLMAAARNLIPNSPAKEGPFSGSGWQAVTGFGNTLGDALASGIPAAGDQVVSKVREIMQAIKDVFGENANLNLNFIFGSNGLSAGLDNVATAASDVQSQLGNAVDTAVPPAKLDGQTKQMADQLSLEKDRLEVERQRLQNQKNLTDDKAARAALQEQINAIDLRKDELELQREQLAYQNKYNEATAEGGSVWDQLAKKVYDATKGVVQAPVDQMMGDLGISGNGALPQLLEQGIALGEQFIFNVGSMDEAVQGQQTITNKKALQFNRR
ncbi:tail length tape measure protein [Mycobacterium phage Rebeuca]|uniref:Tape measure protein n=1 Tax=Mycobacterium phage Rebeuca TaxID=2927991 RepID=J7KLY0_9CAUD|nr:tail length tape measure protein [Mycobacterium phage Rebeuca]AFQ97334.1 tape measure protein [Mycobacterium phage Rebeuca]